MYSLWLAITERDVPTDYHQDLYEHWTWGYAKDTEELQKTKKVSEADETVIDQYERVSTIN